MAVTGTRIRETEDYILEADPAKSEAEGATIWVLGALTVDQRAAVQDGTMTFGADRSFRLSMASRDLAVVRIGLRGVRNFSDERGSPIKFETEDLEVLGSTVTVPTGEFLSRLDGKWVSELANRILNINTVTGEDRKK